MSSDRGCQIISFQVVFEAERLPSLTKREKGGKDMELQSDIARNTSNLTEETNGSVNIGSLQCYHFNSIHFSLRHISPAWYIISFVVNGVSAIATSIINLLVLVTIRRTPPLHSPSNTLLFGLALSDLGVGLIVQPLFFVHILGKLIQNKDFFCEAGIAVEVSANALCIISLLTVTAVSLDRYLALKLHLRYKELITIKRVTSVMVLIWLVGAFIGSLWLYKPDMVKLSVTTTITVCLLAAAISYIQIYRVVSRHYFSDITLKNAVKENRIDCEEAINMAKFKSYALSTFWVYCLIIVCYLPYFCVVIVITFTGLSTVKRFFYEMTAVVIFINSFLNPVIYCWRIQDIRNAVRKTADLLFKFPRKRDRPAPMRR